MSDDTVPGFWAMLGARRDEALGFQGEPSTTLPDDWTPPIVHKGHHGINLAAFAQCHECALRKLRAGLRHPEFSHYGRAARVQRDIRAAAGLEV